MFALLRSTSRRLKYALAFGMCVPSLLGAAATNAAELGSCRETTYEGKSFIVCTFDLRSTTLRLHWKDAGGAPYGNVGSLARAMNRTGGPVLMAINAGMYHADFSPVGLFVSGGRELSPINTTNGSGNFFLKPNGVFVVTETGARVVETSFRPPTP